jgi:hypothetical protein
MPMWRCPHCGTPQAETARCWVCRRSSTACATCRHFRRSVAAYLGYCGLDRRRQPLIGDEIRACWDARPPAAEPGAMIPTIGPAAAPTERAAQREFVEVRPTATDIMDGDADNVPAPLITASEPRWNLWGDLDR